MHIRFSSEEGAVELELQRNGDAKVLVEGSHKSTGRWSKEGNILEIDVPARDLVQGFIENAEEDVSTKDVLVFRLES
jgi:hypothetical protein